MKFLMLAAIALTPVVGLTALVPSPAFAQGGRLYLATNVGVYVPATDNQRLRVTIGNPSLPAPDGEPQLPGVVVYLDNSSDPVTIAPGSTFTYVIDPRETGDAPNQRSLVRSVRVSFRCVSGVLEGAPPPQPSLTIEVLDRRSGVLQAFHAFAGFAGGVRVAASDTDGQP